MDLIKTSCALLMSPDDAPQAHFSDRGPFVGPVGVVSLSPSICMTSNQVAGQRCCCAFVLSHGHPVVKVPGSGLVPNPHQKLGT
jgi:hypothetical protein